MVGSETLMRELVLDDRHDTEAGGRPPAEAITTEPMEDPDGFFDENPSEFRIDQGLRSSILATVLLLALIGAGVAWTVWQLFQINPWLRQVTGLGD